MKLESEVTSFKDFKEISKVMSQGNEKSTQTIQKEFDKVIADKEEEIFHLRDHNKKLLLQIEKAKDKVQCSQKLEEKIQAPQQKLLGKDEEKSAMKKVNQELEEQITKLKRDKQSQDKGLRRFRVIIIY